MTKSNSIRLTLPYPPSANRYWRAARGRVFVSKEAKDFKANVKAIAVKRGLNSPFAGEVRVDMIVYRPARRGDLDNSIKVTLDSLKGITFEDDKQVISICAVRHDDKHDPRVEIVVAEL